AGLHSRRLSLAIPLATRLARPPRRKGRPHREKRPPALTARWRAMGRRAQGRCCRAPRGSTTAAGGFLPCAARPVRSGPGPRQAVGGNMPSDTRVPPVSDRASEAVAPAPDTTPDGQALQFVARGISADCRHEADQYLEEVRVAVGGE